MAVTDRRSDMTAGIMSSWLHSSNVLRLFFHDVKIKAGIYRFNFIHCSALNSHNPPPRQLARTAVM